MVDLKPGRGSDQFPLRLPDGMRDALKAAAEQNGRSMNAEMVARLQYSFDVRTMTKAAILEASASPNGEVNELRAKVAMLTGVNKAQGETLHFLISTLADSEEARERVWAAIKKGELSAQTMRDGSE